MSVFLVTDSPAAVESEHRVVVWLGEDHGGVPGKVTLHAPTIDEFLTVSIEHVLPGLLEPFECALSGAGDRVRDVAESLLERYTYASRQATFDLNTLSWTYKICALHTIQKIRQIPDRMHTVDQLIGLHRDESCVIIGAGPSLDLSAIDPKKILTIATSRAALACFAAGWCPDYIIHIDPAPCPDLVEDLRGHPLSSRARWLMPFQVHRNFLDMPGQTFWFGSRLNPASVWMAKHIVRQFRVPLLTSGGSVSCCAFTIADFMGCSPICLIGQDLSYGVGRKYASEQPLPDRFSSLFPQETDALYLPAIRGGRIQTTMDYASYAEWFIRMARITRRKLINCTTQGVHLPGFEHLSIGKVYRRYGSRPNRSRPDLETNVFPRPPVESAVGRCREVTDELSRLMGQGREQEVFDRIQYLSGHPEADGFLLLAVTQYEQKILSYFSHLPAMHPKMRQCLAMFVRACQTGSQMLDQALTGDVAVPPISEEDVQARYRELGKIVVNKDLII